MMKMLDTTNQLFSPEKARAVAAELAESDPDWTYKVVDCPKGEGYSFIEVYDEDGEFIEKV